MEISPLLPSSFQTRFTMTLNFISTGSINKTAAD
jgi:hypothetical protein